MKKFLHPAKLPLLIPVLGILGLIMRLWLQTTLDGKGFMASGHPAEVLLWIIFGTALVVLFLLTRRLVEAAKYRFNFPASRFSAIGILIGGIGIGTVSLTELLLGTRGVDTFCAIMGVLSTAALFLAAKCRDTDRRPSPLVHTVVSLFFMLRLICQYRTFSADPVLLDYCFQLLALVCLMLASYQRAAFAGGFGSRRSYVFFALGAVFCCILSLVSWTDVLFYLPAGIWMLTDLCSLLPSPSGWKREEA